MVHLTNNAPYISFCNCSPSVCLSACFLSASVQVCLFVYLSVYLPVYLSVCMTMLVCLSVQWFIFLSFKCLMSVYLSVSTPICFSDYMPIFLLVYLYNVQIYQYTCVLFGGASVSSHIGAEVPQTLIPGHLSGNLPLAPMIISLG